ncbi:MAG TPA: hypothetical protein VIG24_17845 [Acidimicrobiia bacterium]
MSVSEPARLALYNRLGEVIGPENAETLMSSLPLQPAAELATKDDVARLEERIDSLANELREVRAQIATQYRTFLTLTIGSLVALTGVFSIIVGLVT